MSTKRKESRLARPLLAFMGVLAAGCGGSPTAPLVVPTPASAPPPIARDGWTEGPVGALFVPAAPRLGERLVVRAPGFLEREALFDGEPLYLWPQDEAYVRPLVYSEFVPGRRLSRWAGAFDVAPLEGEPASVLGGTVTELRRVSGLDITVREDGRVRVVVDAADPYFATSDAIGFARLTFSGNTIIGAKIVFKSPSDINRYYKDVLLHEFGHVLGLGHSTEPVDVMHTGGTARSFSAREAMAIKLMYRWRRAGNALPDRDPGAGALDAVPSTVLIACR